MMNPHSPYPQSVWRIFLFLGFLGPFLTFAQRPLYHPQTHEVGFRVAHLHSTPSLSEYYQDGNGTLQFVNGLQYKFHWDLYNVFRFSAGTRKSTFDATFDIPVPDQILTEQEDLDLRLGYEGNIPFGALTLLGGLEGVFNRSTQSQVFLNTETGEELSRENFEQNAWGANAFGGIKVYFSPHFSTTLEGNLTYLANDYADVFEVYQPDLSGGEWNLGINLFVSVHFVKLKKRCACGG